MSFNHSLLWRPSMRHVIAFDGAIRNAAAQGARDAMRERQNKDSGDKSRFLALLRANGLALQCFAALQPAGLK